MTKICARDRQLGADYKNNSFKVNNLYMEPIIFLWIAVLALTLSSPNISVTNLNYKYYSYFSFS